MLYEVITVLEDIRKQLALCLDSSDPVELPPMLLLGEPGIRNNFV